MAYDLFQKTLNTSPASVKLYSLETFNHLSKAMRLPTLRK